MKDRSGATSVTKEEQLALLQAKMKTALFHLRSAESELEQAVRELSPLLVGDKQLITTTVEESFAKLRNAQDLVASLEHLISPPRV